MVAFQPSRRTLGLAVLAIAILAAITYLPFLTNPFISDDYVQIDLARKFGPMANWGDLLADPLYRCRATSLLLTYWTDQIFGLKALAYNASSLTVHILNAVLLLLLGSWRVIGWRISAVAACFFAVYEGHQEAVVWYAALPELLVFFFSLLSVLLWLAWLRNPRPILWAATMAAFLLALASKESGVVVAPLLIVVGLVERAEWRRLAIAVTPFLFLCGVYFGLAFAERSNHLHFNDGTFSLNAPFWIPWSRTFFRLFWFWGLLSLAVVWKLRERRLMALLAVAGLWISVTLMPYSFLTYMPRIPSRHTYLASVGAALVVAAALHALTARLGPGRRWVTPVLAGCIVVHNWGYLWAVKHPQFTLRAEPTEQLLKHVERSKGPISLDCFPYGIEVADAALRLTGHSSEVNRLQPRHIRSESECRSRSYVGD